MKTASWALAVLVLAAHQSHSQAPSTRDSAGVRIVTSTAPLWDAAHALRIDGKPQLVIGDKPGDPYELSKVKGAALLADGRIVIADGGSLQLRFYDSLGVFIKSSGGRGDGPGEFRSFESLSHLAGDTLVVMAPVGMRGSHSYFTGAGDFLFRVSPASAAPQARGPLGKIHAPLAAFADGSSIDGAFEGNPQPRERGARWIEPLSATLVDRQGATVRSLGDLPMSLAVMEDRPRPPWFAAEPAFANNDDTFFYGYGAEYSIRVYARDGTLKRIIRRSWTPQRVTKADIDTYVVEWGKRWIKSTGAAAEKEREDLRDDPYAVTVPAFSQFIAARDGVLWVRKANLADAPGAGALNTMPLVPSVWSLFDREGRWLCDVTLPALFRPYDIGSNYVMGVSRDSDGVETVVRFRLRRP